MGTRLTLALFSRCLLDMVENLLQVVHKCCFFRLVLSYAFTTMVTLLLTAFERWLANLLVVLTKLSVCILLAGYCWIVEPVRAHRL